MMIECEVCGLLHTSRLAAEECAAADEIEARNTREWFTKYNPNYRP